MPGFESEKSPITPPEEEKKGEEEKPEEKELLDLARNIQKERTEEIEAIEKKIKEKGEKRENWEQERYEIGLEDQGYINYQLIEKQSRLSVAWHGEGDKDLVEEWNKFASKKISPDLKDLRSVELLKRLKNSILFDGGRAPSLISPKSRKEGIEEPFMMGVVGAKDGEEYIEEFNSWLNAHLSDSERQANEVKGQAEFWGKLKEGESSNPPKRSEIERFERWNLEKVSRRRKSIEESQENARIHLRGFGKAALEAGDLIPAIDSLDYSGNLEDPEIISEVKKRMEKLKKSKKSEDKETLLRTSKKLAEMLGKEKN